MKKKCSIFAVLLMVIGIQYILAEEAQPVATITEIEGKVEIHQDNAWVPAIPLAPLYPNDIIRVSPNGKVVILYLGISTELVTEANSPYTVRMTKVGEDRKSKVQKKIKSALLGFFRKAEMKTIPLITRGAKASMNVSLPPLNTKILFPKDTMIFEWEACDIPCHVEICNKNEIGGNNIIFEKELREDKILIPGKIFSEKHAYEWTIYSERKEESGVFKFLGKSESKKILAELSEIVREIPKEFAVTHIAIQYSCLIEQGLFYDADLLLREAEKIYSENETLRRLDVQAYIEED